MFYSFCNVPLKNTPFLYACCDSGQMCYSVPGRQGHDTPATTKKKIVEKQNFIRIVAHIFIRYLFWCERSLADTIAGAAAGEEEVTLLKCC